MIPIRSLPVVVLVVSTGSATIGAQTTQRIAPGARIRITLLSAQRIEARYVAGEAGFLSYRSEALPEEQVVAWDSVQTVEAWHRGGATLGGFLGAAAGLGVGVLIGRRYKEEYCRGFCIGPDAGTMKKVAVAIGTMSAGLVVGMTAGWLLAQPHWTTVSPRVAPHVEALPEGRLGVGARLRF